MKKIIVGVVILLLSLFLSWKYTYAGCGACSDTVIYKPTLLIFGLPSEAKPSPKFCAVAGCSLLQRPVFVDLSAIAAVFIASGFYSYRKRLKKNKKF